MSNSDQAIRDIVKGASIVYVGLFVELLIAFVAQVLAARYLSVSGFGGLTTGTALLNIGAIVGGLGLASGLTRYLPRVQDSEKRALTWFAIGITLATSTALGLTTVLNAEFIASEVFGDPEVTVSIRIFGAAIPFSTLLNIGIGGIRGQKHSLYQVYVKNLLHPILRFVFVVVALVYGLGQAGFAGAYALPYVASAAVAIVLLHRSLPRSHATLDRELTTEMTRYSLPFTISGIASFIYRSIDIFLILWFLGSFEVGIYGVAYAAVSFMGMFSTAFNFLGSPVASELEGGGNVDEVMRVFRSVARWLMVASVCTLVPLGIFSTEFISIIYQSKYESGGLALTILAVGFAWKNVLSIHGPILRAIGRSKIVMFNDVIAAMVNLVLNLVFIPRFGISGAAVATVLAFLLQDGLAAIEVRYFLGTTPLSWEGLGPGVVAVPFLGVFAAVVAPEIPITFLWLVGTTGLFSVFYGGMVLLVFGLSDTEVMILQSIEEKYGVNLGPLTM